MSAMSQTPQKKQDRADFCDGPQRIYMIYQNKYVITFFIHFIKAAKVG